MCWILGSHLLWCWLGRNWLRLLRFSSSERVAADSTFRIQLAIGSPAEFANVQGSFLHQPCRVCIRRVYFALDDRQTEDLALEFEYREGAVVTLPIMTPKSPDVDEPGGAFQSR